MALSFGNGRLGNQMSTFASLYAFERIHGVRTFVTARQAEVMLSYFQQQSLVRAPVRVLETYLPEWKQLCWRNPFP